MGPKVHLKCSIDGNYIQEHDALTLPDVARRYDNCTNNAKKGFIMSC